MPPSPPRRRWPLVAATSAAVVLLVAAGTAGALYVTRNRHTPDRSPQSFIVTGDLILKPSDLSGALAIRQGQPCAGKGGYDDIQGGVSVVVYGPADQAVAIGQLSEGFGDTGDFGDSPTCRFTFAIQDVPAGLKFYSVEVSHRGKVHYSEAQLGQALHLTLGA